MWRGPCAEWARRNERSPSLVAPRSLQRPPLVLRIVGPILVAPTTVIQALVDAGPAVVGGKRDALVAGERAAGEDRPIERTDCRGTRVFHSEIQRATIPGGVVDNGSDMTSAPLPPAELAAYILGYEDTTGVLEAYIEQGERIAEAIERLLGPGWSWQGKRVLDFGCGAARVLRQFLGHAGEADLHGVELDESCVDWIEANLSPPLRVIHGTELPPLPYPEAYFDLIWSTSVFSHLADSWSAWLLDLRRLLKPGGVAVVSVMGAASSQAIAYEEWDPNRIGMTVLGYGRPWRAGGPMVLHSEWWIRAHWGRAFTVEAFEERGIEGQDAVVLLRDKRLAPTIAELEAPQPGDPRELVAARHAIELLHCEHAALNRQHDEYAQAYIIEARNHAATAARVAALETELQYARDRAALGVAQRTMTSLHRRLSI